MCVFYNVTSHWCLFIPENSFGDKQPPILTFQDVIVGTRDFHHELRISEGPFSDLYRAQMGNKTFAVKLFKQVDNDVFKLWSFIVCVCVSSAQSRICLTQCYTLSLLMLELIQRRPKDAPKHIFLSLQMIFNLKTFQMDTLNYCLFVCTVFRSFFSVHSFTLDEEQLTEVCLLLITLQKNMTSWKKNWDIFRKEIEILCSCVLSLTLRNIFLCSSDKVWSVITVVMCYRYPHPNIIELLGCFSDGGSYCLVYAYLPNGSLFHTLHHQVDL